jgi:DUF218 domain
MPLRSPALRPRIIDFAVQLTPRSCFRCLQAFGLLYLSVQSDDSNRHPRPFDADDPLCAHRTEAGIREPRRSSASRPLACGQCVHASLGEPLSGLGVSHGVPDGILLGGAVDASGPDEQAVLNEAAERLVVVPELARRYPNTRILFSGGNSALMDGGSAEAEFAALLESLGVERSRITLEDRSRNTVENAVFSKALIQPKSGDRWLLVTSAYHMPRAIGVFRKGGLSGRTLSGRSAHTCRRGCAVAICDHERRAAADRHCLHEWIGLSYIGSPGAPQSCFRGQLAATLERSCSSQ